MRYGWTKNTLQDNVVPNIGLLDFYDMSSLKVAFKEIFYCDKGYIKFKI